MKGLRTSAALLLILVLAGIATAEPEAAEDGGRRGSWLVTNLSERDILIHVSSIEWGSPDRWSFTTRYIHQLRESSKEHEWFPNLCVTLSPGTDGGRVGLGFLGIWSPAEYHDFGLIHELRAVYLRSWRNPMAGESGTGYWGAELRLGLGWINLGAGYYAPRSSEDEEAFWGLHLGLGI